MNEAWRPGADNSGNQASARPATTPPPAMEPAPPLTPPRTAYPTYQSQTPRSYYQPPPSAQRPGTGLPRPVAVQAVPGTDAFGVAIVGIAPGTSGMAWASLVAGVGSILVSLVVFCFGGVGADRGWGPIVAGAFALLAGIVGVAAVALGRVGLAQIKRAVNWGATKGRGLAIAGMVCGGVGLLLTVVAVLMAFALTAG